MKFWNIITHALSRLVVGVCIGATLLVLSWDTAKAEQAVLPLTIDYPLLTQLYIQAVFPEGANKLALADSRDGCMQLYFSEPKFSMQNGLLLFDVLGYVRAGTQVANTCVAPLEWKGIFRFVLKPQLNSSTFALTFTIIDSKVYKPNYQPDKMVAALWALTEPFLFKHFQAVSINLGPPVKDLKSFLLPLFPYQTQNQTKKMLDSMSAGDVRVGENALTADLLVDVERSGGGQSRGTGAATSQAELQKAIKLWETWDSFLVQMITTLGRYKLTIREQDILSDVLLDTRYAFIDALDDRKVGQDFVRNQFVEDWKKLAPVFRNHLAQTKKDALLGYLAFFTASDALGVFDALGPAFGIEISEPGFVRLTTMLGNSEQALKYVPNVNPQLRNVLQLPNDDKTPQISYPEKEIEVSLPPEPAESTRDLQKLRRQLKREGDKETQDQAVPTRLPAERTDDVRPQIFREPRMTEPERVQPEPEQNVDRILERQGFREQDLPPQPSEKKEKPQSNADQSGDPLSFLWDFLCASATAANSPLADRILEWRVPKDDIDGYIGRVRAMLVDVTKKVQQGKNLAADLQDTFGTLISAMAWQESCMRQFVQDGTKMSYLLSYNNTSVGIMQVNERVWRGVYDLNRLRWDIAYNATAGAEIAGLYMEKALSGNRNIGQKKDLLIRAVYAMYNGGPGQLDKFIERDKRNSTLKTDQLFLEKLRWVQGNAWQNIDQCLPDK